MSEQTQATPAPAAPAKKRIVLPAYFQQGMIAVLQAAQDKDIDYAHWWVKATDEGRQARREMGWEPCEDREVLERLGLKDLIRADGKAHYMDTELWRQPKELQDAIRLSQDQRLADRSASMRAAFDAMADDTKGRSGGKVVPFISTGGQTDVVTRTPISGPMQVTSQK